MCSPDAEDETFISIMLVEIPAFARTACAVLQGVGSTLKVGPGWMRQFVLEGILLT